MSHRYFVILLSIIAVFSGCKKDPTNSNSSIMVNTKPVAEITSTSAISGGDITVEGEVNIDMGGICWSTSEHPTTNDFYTIDVEHNTGSFTSKMTQLLANTKYYVRAYAKSGSNISYGNEITFTTLSNGGGNGGGNGHDEEPVLVSTNNITNITTSSAVCGGNVTVNGNVTVTARGVCWSTSHNPTIAQNHTTDGQGAGPFTSNITGLSANTKYYTKAYATSNSETIYGEEKSFTTEELPQSPSVTVTLINVSPTYLELKFEPSNNTAYYCFNIGGTLTSTTHQTGVQTYKFTFIRQYNKNYYLQPNTEYEFTIIAYDANDIAGEVIHPKYKTSQAPYSNYMRIFDNFYPLYTATITHGMTANPDWGYKDIILNGNTGYSVRLEYLCYYYEIDNVWYSGVYTIGGSGVHSYACDCWKNGSQFCYVDAGSTFTITKSGNMVTYDLYGNDPSGMGAYTAHFTGY